MTTLIKNATCVLPQGTMKADVLIEHDTIASVDAPAGTTADEVVDAAGLHLLPGVVDAHVHFRDPGVTHKEDLHTGSRAAVKGGVTTFLEMPNTSPHASTQERIDDKRRIASEKSLANYGFYIAATTDNLEDLKHAERVPGIKIFIGSSTGDLFVDDQETLEAIFAETTLPICAHCEDETTVRANAAKLDGGHEYADHSKIRDHAAAIVCTRRTLDLARRHKHRFHMLHTSTAAELDEAEDRRGLITTEVCPHHLYFNTGDYARLGALVQMNPSVKEPEDNAALWQGLLDGRVQVIATDHAPHLLSEKDQPYPKSPSGVPAVENSLALLLNEVNQGRCTLDQVVHWMCDAPARVWDMVGKGRIAEGYDADLVLVDLNKTDTIHNADQATKCGWSPWDGTELTGWPARTWVLGQEAFRDGAFCDDVRGRPVVFDHARGGYWATS